MKWIRLFGLTVLVFMLSTAALAQDATEEPTGEAEVPAQLPAATPTAEEPVAGPGREIQVGATVEGSLSPQSPTVVYNFVATAGTVVTIEMASNDLDSYLRLGDQRGNQLLADDDSGEDLDARIGPVRLPEDGAYVVIASSFDNTFSDGNEVEAGDFAVRVLAYEPETIAYNNPVEATLEEDEVLHVYSFEGQIGSVLRLSLDSEDFDPMLMLTDASNVTSPTIRDDDSGEGTNALIVPYLVQVTAPYLLAVVAVDGEVGDYTLAVTALEATPVTASEPVTLTLTREEQAAGIFSYSAGEGEVVDIVVESSTELDTTLTVLGPDGSQVGFNDDTNARNPALVGLALPGAGTYTFIVQPFVRGNSGEITIQVAPSATP